MHEKKYPWTKQYRFGYSSPQINDLVETYWQQVEPTAKKDEMDHLITLLREPKKCSEEGAKGKPEIDPMYFCEEN